jgi:serine protease Do
MLDLSGKVVGINTAIRAHSNNIGFAIPIEIVSALLPALVTVGRVQRSALGVTVDAVPPRDQLHRAGKIIRGAVVRAIQSAGPADRAGIQIGDVVIDFDGRAIDTPESLQWFVSIAGVGRVANVTVIRNATVLQFKATLTELQTTPEVESEPETD